jgi:hypothetical protein
MVYVDNMNISFRRMIMSHMVADTSKELITMAKLIGVNEKWIQCPGTYNEHFDICLSMKKKALSLGAKAITFRKYAEFVNKRKKPGDIWYKKPKTKNNAKSTTPNNRVSRNPKKGNRGGLKRS